ncbi:MULTISPECIES: hypothetical protein [Dyella]|nr:MULTISPECIES: hypothetical protein [Dyella]
MRSAKWVLGLTVCCVLPVAAWAADNQSHAGNSGNASSIPPVFLAYGPDAPAAYAAGTKVEGSPHVEGLGQSTADDQLADMSGGTNVKQNTTLNGTVTGNTASRVVSGSNAISGESFSGASGLPTVIQNTGSNVLIQNATVVNVQFTP